MKYCSNCATPLVFSIPPGDQVARHHCTACGTVHYQNPRIITCTVPVWQNRVLLCKRAIEPRLGFWTLPGGFMENGETMAEGALRETWEEACVRPTLRQLMAIVDLPQYDQVHVFYLADMPNDHFALTPESSAIELFAPNEIPWQALSFRTVEAALRHYVQHHDTNGQIPLHESTIPAH